MAILWSILYLVLAILGAFILGVLVGRFWEGRLVIDGETVGGHGHGDDGHH